MSWCCPVSGSAPSEQCGLSPHTATLRRRHSARLNFYELFVTIASCSVPVLDCSQLDARGDNATEERGVLYYLLAVSGGAKFIDFSQGILLVTRQCVLLTDEQSNQWVGVIYRREPITVLERLTGTHINETHL